MWEPHIYYVLSDPKPESIPESYFLDDKMEDCTIESEGSGSDEKNTQNGGGNEISDTGINGGSREAVSPRATSNSRRKRKRKTSQSETRKHTSSFTCASPTSPAEIKLPSMLRVSPSPPIPASPVTVTSPSSPVGASAPVCSPKLSANISSDSYDCSSTSSTPVIKSSSNNKSKDSFFDVCDLGRKTPNGDGDGFILKANSAPGESSLGGKKSQHMSLTPRSGPGGRAINHSKTKKNNPTRLMDKFSTIIQDSDSLDPKKKENDNYIRQRPPSGVEGAAKGPWAGISKGYMK